jgi:hypothetical protein
MNACSLFFLMASLMGLGRGTLIAKDFDDDFSRNSGDWRVGAGGKGQHVVHNGMLEFTTQGASTDNDSATHYLKVPVGKFNESWEVQVDVHMGSFPLGQNNPYAGLALKVSKASDAAGSFVRLQLRRGSEGKRAFNADSYTDRKFCGSEWKDTTSETAQLRIQFDRKTKILTASFDADGAGSAEQFVSLCQIDIGSAATNWQMKSKDVFELSLVSQSTRTTVAPGDMHFDKVVVKTIGH